MEKLYITEYISLLLTRKNIFFFLKSGIPSSESEILEHLEENSFVLQKQTPDGSKKFQDS